MTPNRLTRYNKAKRQLEAIIFEKREEKALNYPYANFQAFISQLIDGDEDSIENALRSFYDWDVRAISRNIVRSHQELANIILSITVYELYLKHHLQTIELASSILHSSIQLINQTTSVAEVFETLLTALFLLKDNLLQKANSHHYLVTKIKQYIEQNLNHRIHIGQFATQLGYQASYLSKLFKDYEK
ncbi:hypothetical protein [Streptococcus sp. zg-JUN1979]|uniref:hypothetical protein n=1 Tax=Streptococcus sp. zg-JUN1979 TaxID=3391450 RepID=UPI0039A44F77